MNTKEPVHYETTGHLCQTFQRSYGAIRKAIEQVGAQPAHTVNGCAYYASDTVEAIGEQLRATAKPATRKKSGQ
ncbi:MAG: hypothetical protein WCJ35_20575 [Planctomycetota bacterium]